MENSNFSKNRGNEYLGVNKMGKNIRKSPLHQPNYATTNGSSSSGGGGGGGNPVGAGRPQHQPQVYTISKNDFRSFVQQHTGSPARDTLPRQQPSNPARPASLRLQRIRPPPLTPINRPPMGPLDNVRAPPVQSRPPAQGMNVYPAHQIPYANMAARPLQYGQPSPGAVRPLPGVNPGWMNPALSPLSSYMQQFQSCLADAGPRPAQDQPHVLPQIPGQVQARNQSEPQFLGQAHGQWPSSGLLPSPSMPSVPSPRMNTPGLLPSPTLSSPSAFLDLWTPPPRSPYPLLSPGSRFPPPLSPNFSFASMNQSGIWGPGPLSPLSPGIGFPLSPSAFFPLSSPRWRAQ